jgi:CDP-diacylglycerol--glycerol-3-phosphate 3-phosphatidyltransferase
MGTMSERLATWLSSPGLTWIPLVFLIVVFALALAGFAVRNAIRGRPHSARVGQAGGGSILLGEYFMEYGLWVFGPVARAATKLELHPDTLSWASLVLQLLAAVALSQGGFGLAGWLMLVGAACDSLDGSVARARGLASDAGEVLDAVIDRWAEMAIFFGYAWYYRGFPLAFAFSVAACSGAVMVSYTRAKGEAMDVDARGGLMQRHERAVYLVSATVFSSLAEAIWPSPGRPLHLLVVAALGLIALFGNLTGIRRTVFIRRELRKR